MKGVSFFTKHGFLLGKVTKQELKSLEGHIKKDGNQDSLKEAIRDIKLETSASYYRNLEYRLSQTKKKELDETRKTRIEFILKQVRKVNWNTPDPPAPSAPPAPAAPPAPPAPAGPSAPAPAPAGPAPAGPSDPPSNAPGLPGSSGSSDSSDSSVSQKERIHTLTKAEVEKINTAVTDASTDTNWNELNVLKFDLRGTGKRYYRKTEGGKIHHVGGIFKTEDKLPEDSQASGAEKRMTHKTPHYVRLNFGDEVPTNKTKKFNSFSINTLRKYPSLSQSIFVDKNTMVSSNKGTTLNDIVYGVPSKKIDLHQFEPLLKDLNLMQSEHIYITDFKLDNLTSDENGDVCSIDLDTLCAIGFNLSIDITPERITTSLYSDYKKAIKPFVGSETLEESVYDPKRERSEEYNPPLHQALSNISNYALLVTLIEATEGLPIPSMENAYYDTDRIYSLNDFFNFNAFPEPIATNPTVWGRKAQNSTEELKVKHASHTLTKAWIKQHAKPAYVQTLINFATAPHEQKIPLNLHKMLNFNKPIQAKPNEEESTQF